MYGTLFILINAPKVAAISAPLNDTIETVMWANMSFRCPSAIFVVIWPPFPNKIGIQMGHLLE